MPLLQGQRQGLTASVVSSRIEREIKNRLKREKAEAILVEVHHSVASLLIGSNGLYLKEDGGRNGPAYLYPGLGPYAHREICRFAVGPLERGAKSAYPVEVGEKYQVKIEEPHANNPYDGIARVSGFVLDVIGGGAFVGETVEVQEIARTGGCPHLCQGQDRPKKKLEAGEAPGLCFVVS
jgi:ribonuclease G